MKKGKENREHYEMVWKTKEFVRNEKKEYTLNGSTNLPKPCNNKTKWYHPDVLIYKGKTINFIVEPETSTGETTIIGKIFLANKCIEKMIKHGTHDENVKPKLIFVYSKIFPETRLEKLNNMFDEFKTVLNYVDLKKAIYFEEKIDWLI